MSNTIKRGSVYWTALDPVRGSEIAKTRPCVVVSAEEINAVRRTVVIVPFTTTPSPVQWPLVLAVPSAGPTSKARIEQLRGVDKSRLGKYIGEIGDADMQEIGRALKQVLVLD
jgi:mRNA interferase MazF